MRTIERFEYDYSPCLYGIDKEAGSRWYEAWASIPTVGMGRITLLRVDQKEKALAAIEAHAESWAEAGYAGGSHYQEDADAH